MKVKEIGNFLSVVICKKFVRELFKKEYASVNFDVDSNCVLEIKKFLTFMPL